jgi:hypothetical protein
MEGLTSNASPDSESKSYKISRFLGFASAVLNLFDLPQPLLSRVHACYERMVRSTASGTTKLAIDVVDQFITPDPDEDQPSDEWRFRQQPATSIHRNTATRRGWAPRSVNRHA